ncbi:MOSC domain-containing protein [Arthrobacter alpinus]|uniref:Molybdenum cofactor biosysynthesis protein n=1 Tax=Arthrobacter alpinus TaxID=656366 RepID=A0A0S2LY29_9MICC|nr:MOSC domain-containing protein [Arthrobacter alpinus]ALO66232.1 molybdenum cofactor biosysynthesis protein [Arthrobacter alpinus]MDD0858927.1 MOSC domain-containing protein [Arthrobacter alpinus]
MNTNAQVSAVHLDTSHRFSKESVEEIELEAGLGVAGDAHRGVTVQHLSRVRADPTAPNLRQVHLIQQELFEWLEPRGFSVAPGELGENITTRGVDLLKLPRGTLLHLGEHAVVELTGLRNPCSQIEDFRPGLLKELVGHDDGGTVVRRAGVMGVVRTGGAIRPDEPIVVVLPEGPHEALERV